MHLNKYAQFLTWCLICLSDLIQDGKQCCDGNCWSWDHGHLHGPRSSEEGFSACTPMHKEAANRPANYAWSNTSFGEPCAIPHTAKTSNPLPIIYYTFICQSALLHGWVCKPQNPTHAQLPVYEYLRCSALSQVWRGNFPEQWVKKH